MSESSLRPLRLQAGPLRVEFRRNGDRIAHRLELISDDRELVIAESMENGEYVDWPASPPFQQVSETLAADQQAIMLVGMAGRTHWSAAISLVHGALDFDIACRLTGEPGSLGSTYKTVGGVDVARTRTGADLVLGQPSGRVIIVPQEGTGLERCEAGFRIFPLSEATSDAKSTRRWRYRVRRDER